MSAGHHGMSKNKMLTSNLKQGADSTGRPVAEGSAFHSTSGNSESEVSCWDNTKRSLR